MFSDFFGFFSNPPFHYLVVKKKRNIKEHLVACKEYKTVDFVLTGTALCTSANMKYVFK